MAFDKRHLYTKKPRDPNRISRPSPASLEDSTSDTTQSSDQSSPPLSVNEVTMEAAIQARGIQDDDGVYWPPMDARLEGDH